VRLCPQAHTSDEAIMVSALTASDTWSVHTMAPSGIIGKVGRARLTIPNS